MRRLLGLFVAAGGLALLASCMTERPTGVASARSGAVLSANTEVCGSGSEPDPHPGTPGIFLCSVMTADFCFNGWNTDQDGDGLSDFCEKQLSYAFRPELRYSTVHDDIRGEPYWVARQDSSGHVLIGYLFSYYRDLGSVQYGCSSPILPEAEDSGCHNGDSEGIWLSIYYNPQTLHWVLRDATYSQHNGQFKADYDASTGYPAVEYPAQLGGYPRVWIAEGKHASYIHPYFGPTDAFCQGGGPAGTDTCGDDDASIRLDWSDYWNIGSQAHPFVNEVASRNPSYEYYGLGRTECYWKDKPFRGWVPDNIGGGQAASYLRKLAFFGYSTVAGASSGCPDAPPPQQPPPPPPLSASIAADPPNYTVSPAGGAPPYTYLWEVCAIDCAGGGGEASPVFRGAPLRTVAHGWQVLSTSWQVYWTSRQRTLRLTVTDSHGAQAQALYTIP